MYLQPLQLIAGPTVRSDSPIGPSSINSKGVCFLISWKLEEQTNAWRSDAGGLLVSTAAAVC